MSHAEDLETLTALWRDGAISADEYAQGLAALCASPPVAETAEQWAAIRREEALARLDRDWRAEREAFTVAGGGRPALDPHGVRRPRHGRVGGRRGPVHGPHGRNSS